MSIGRKGGKRGKEGSKKEGKEGRKGEGGQRKDRMREGEERDFLTGRGSAHASKIPCPANGETDMGLLTQANHVYLSHQHLRK